MRNLPEPVTEPEHPALAGGFLFTALPGKLQVLVVVQGIFSGGMRALSCNMRDPVSQPGIHPRPPVLGVQSRTSGPPGKAQDACLSVHLPSQGVVPHDALIPC